MYKLIIADDEKVIRRGLVDLIPWTELGFSVEADFEDGREAIEYLRHHDVQAVLTDVRMTEISGLELAKWVHEHMPHVKVIIISGYKEFDYARQAIQYNVSRYLLKPTKLDEIESVFNELKRELVKEERDQAERRRSQEWLPLLRDQFFTDLLMGALRCPQELVRRIEWIGLPFAAADGCCVADIRLDAVSGSDGPVPDSGQAEQYGPDTHIRAANDGPAAHGLAANNGLAAHIRAADNGPMARSRAANDGPAAHSLAANDGSAARTRADMSSPANVQADERERIVAGLSRLLQQQGEGGISFYPVPNRELGFKVVGIWGRGLDAESGRRLAERQLDQLIDSARAIFAFDITARIEHSFGSLTELAGHSEKVRLTLQESSGKVRLEEREYARLVTKYKLFISNVVEGNAAEVSSLMDRFLEEFRDAPAGFTHRLIKDLFAIIRHTLGGDSADVKLLTGKVLNYDMAFGELDEIWSLSKHTVTEVMETISTARNESSKLLVDQARQFIQQHYREDISLDNVADHVFLHPVYFSKLFKQHAGINFSEYLTRLRIGKAKELIHTGQYKMYEVGSMVGYPNSKYFYRVFKQTVGCTPTEYAESANGENLLQ